MKFPDEIIQKVDAERGSKEAPRTFFVDVLVKISARFQGGKGFGEGKIADVTGIIYYI